MTVGDSQIFSDPQQDFQPDEDPQFELTVPSTTPALTGTAVFDASSSFPGSPGGLFAQPGSTVLPRSWTPANIPDQVLSAEIYAPDGSVSSDTPVVGGAGDALSVTIPDHPSSFKPGLYTLKVEVLDGSEVLVATHQFAWGVLAINTGSQSSYSPGDTAHIQNMLGTGLRGPHHVRRAIATHHPKCRRRHGYLPDLRRLPARVEYLRAEQRHRQPGLFR